MIAERRVVVVGAGPGGAAVSYFLARGGAEVVLFDKSDFPRDKTCGDALSPRALGVIEAMGLLDEVSAGAHRADEVRIHAPDRRSAQVPLPRPRGLPGHVLVVPRLRLDHLLESRAVEAGAHFRRARVASLARGDGRVRGVVLEDGSVVEAGAVVLATGAATPLVRDAGLLPPSPLGVAARRYYDDIPGLAPRLEIFFDGVDLPGYAWLFPSGDRSANVGVGFFGDAPRSPATALARLVETHPILSRTLAGARADGPARGFPLRIGLPPARLTRPGLIAVGEAAGLVNPLTGEGIDYALESGRLAAQALLDAADPEDARVRYDRAARARFRRLFVVLQGARRLYFNAPMLNRIFGRGSRRPYLVRTLVEVCFGNAEPLRVVGPRAVLELLRP